MTVTSAVLRVGCHTHTASLASYKVRLPGQQDDSLVTIMNNVYSVACCVHFGLREENPGQGVEVETACGEKRGALRSKEGEGRRKRGWPKRRRFDRVRDGIKEKRLSADEVYDIGYRPP